MIASDCSVHCGGGYHADQTGGLHLRVEAPCSHMDLQQILAVCGMPQTAVHSRPHRRQQRQPAAPTLLWGKEDTSLGSLRETYITCNGIRARHCGNTHYYIHKWTPYASMALTQQKLAGTSMRTQHGMDKTITGTYCTNSKYLAPMEKTGSIYIHNPGNTLSAPQYKTIATCHNAAHQTTAVQQ